MPLPALGELPQLTALSLAWRRLIDVKPVLMAVNNTSLVCCWDQSGRWQQRVVGWPDGVCRDGVPLQREAVGELIADLIFDCDCPGAELVLCLPLDAASWCVLDGYGSDGPPGLLPQALQSVDLPFGLAESYVTSSPVQEALALVGVPRSLIQAWREVAELVDLPLRRVDWLLTAAQRALHQLMRTWDGDLDWLVMEEKSLRLLLFRQGVPEVEHALEQLDPLACQRQIRACVACLNQPLPVWAEPLDDCAAGEVTDVPSVLQQLLQTEINALDPVAKRVGNAKARLRAMRSRRSTLEQQKQSVAESWWR